MTLPDYIAKLQRLERELTQQGVDLRAVDVVVPIYSDFQDVDDTYPSVTDAGKIRFGETWRVRHHFSMTEAQKALMRPCVVVAQGN